MKSIYLIRHADSNWNNPDYSDFDRPLSEKGFKDIPVMANKLAELGFNPELIVCSPALRTTTTAELLLKSASYLFESSIYEASLDDLIQLVNVLPNEYQEIALIGHNPGISLLSDYLTDNYMTNMSPCSVIKIELEIDNWNEVVQGIGTEVYSISPETLV